MTCGLEPTDPLPDEHPLDDRITQLLSNHGRHGEFLEAQGLRLSPLLDIETTELKNRFGNLGRFPWFGNNKNDVSPNPLSI